MKYLLVIDYRRQVLGALSVDSQNRLELRVFSSAYQEELQQLISEITTHIPLPLRTYEKRMESGNYRMFSKIIRVQLENPDFLWAVREHLNGNVLSGTFIVGQIIDKPDVANTLPSNQVRGTV
jgi:hypothetical protein